MNWGVSLPLARSKQRLFHNKQNVLLCKWTTNYWAEHLKCHYYDLLDSAGLPLSGACSHKYLVVLAWAPGVEQTNIPIVSPAIIAINGITY